VERLLPAVATAGQPALIGLCPGTGSARSLVLARASRKERNVEGHGFLVLLPRPAIRGGRLSLRAAAAGRDRFEQIRDRDPAPSVSSRIPIARRAREPGGLSPAGSASAFCLARSLAARGVAATRQDRPGSGGGPRAGSRPGEDWRGIHWISLARAGRLKSPSTATRERAQARLRAARSARPCRRGIERA